MTLPTRTNPNLILRLEFTPPGLFATVVSEISELGGDLVGIDMIESTAEYTVRDLTITVADQQMADRIVEKVKQIPGIRLIHVSDSVFMMHLGGKLEVQPKFPIKNRDDLSRVYTPGVARVSTAIHQDENLAFTFTMKRNTVAVVSDGTAVLGLGDIGPKAALPVMEGKAVLFKQFAGVDAVPICLDTKDPDEIVRTVKLIAPAFGGINLEDISSPRCFEIEERLKQELDIPVFHDDQHGTAVVTLAGLYNALKIVNKRIDEITVVIAGAGAAGVAIAKMLLNAGVKNLIGVARAGVIERNGNYTQYNHRWFAENTNPENVKGTLSDAIVGADVFIGVSQPNTLTVDDVKKMARDPIVFAMANPVPEIDPIEAAPYVRVMATGRSDFPNQINNVLCFPGIFRGALDCRASEINEEMKMAAAKAIASVVSDDELNESYIIPSVFHQQVVERVRDAVIEAAIRTGVARRRPRRTEVFA